jgi:hypothetical protein
MAEWMKQCGATSTPSPPGHRPLYDRLHRLILAAYPVAVVVLSYRMPTYKVGNRRLYVGTWKHGVSIYVWEQGRAAGFIARHPALNSSRCRPAPTLRLRRTL